MDIVLSKSGVKCAVYKISDAQIYIVLQNFIKIFFFIKIQEIVTLSLKLEL